MKDFWLSCGHHLLDRDEGGGLVVTDEFLKAYLARPELAPPPEACVVERTLHAALLADPRRPVAAAEIAAIADADARENWERDDRVPRSPCRLHKTVEAAYLDIVRRGVGTTPPLFINQLVHVILRNVLDGCEDAYMLRAAELFFRPQRLTVHDGSLIAADEEVIAATIAQPVSPLVAMLDLPSPTRDRRAQRRQCASLLGAQRPVRHGARPHRRAARARRARRRDRALGVASACRSRSAIEPLVEASNVALTWYVGLDAEATRIGDALWNGEELDEATRARIVGLYRATVRDAEVVLDKARGEPIYLILAMTPDGKPAHEAAESRDRPADPASGGGIVSVAPRSRGLRSASWSSGARRRAGGSISPGGRSPCCRTAGGGAVDRAVRRRRDDDLLCGLDRDRALSHRDRPIIATISPPARRRCGSRCGRPASSRPMSSSR